MKAYQTYLAEQLIERKKNNPLYSLRAFAKALEISPSQLSSLLSGRKTLSSKLARKIFERLNTDKISIQSMLEDMVIEDSSDESYFQVLESDDFQLISQWQYFAILSLAHIKDNKANSKWISDRLGIDPVLALESFNRLVKMGLIKVMDGSFRQTTKPLHTNSDVSSIEIRNYHRSNLALAAEKIETTDINLREYTSITVDVDLKKLPRAKKMINDFKKNLSDFLCTGKTSEVYTLAIQLFPLTKVKQYEN